MQNEYTLSQNDAQQDWHIFASELAAGAVSPPADLLRSVGEAAGGLPKGVTPTRALKASAQLLVERGVINEQ
ncbi:MAG: hypothetical protein ACR2NF_04025 [Pirellulales bacterium]